MGGRKVLLGMVIGCVVALVASQTALGGEDRGGRRGFNPERMRQMMFERIKDNLEVEDDAWTVMQPRLEAVMNLSRDAGGGGGMRGLFRRRRPGGEERPEQPEREVSAAQKAREDLEKLLENKEAKPDEIKAKLKALREAREKAKEELAKAKESLKEILTQRQEAQLVLYGILD